MQMPFEGTRKPKQQLMRDELSYRLRQQSLLGEFGRVATLGSRSSLPKYTARLDLRTYVNQVFWREHTFTGPPIGGEKSLFSNAEVETSGIIARDSDRTAHRLLALKPRTRALRLCFRRDSCSR
jgi:hypothetical protein